MKRLLRRQVLGYALGLLTAVAGFAVGAAWAGHSATDNNTITACASHEDGVLYLLNRGQKKPGCHRRDATVTWSITGPQGIQGLPGDKGDKGDKGVPGNPGSLSNAVSPNGVFTVTLSNAGILLKGPNGDVHVDFLGARMNTIGGQP